MANEIKLEAYTFGIRRQNESDFLNLNQLFLEEGFIGFFQKYLKHLETELEVNETQSKALQLQDKSLRFQNLAISGIFKSGQYGYEGDIVNVTNGNIDFKKHTNHSELLPFYFLVHSPNMDRGIVLLQRFGIFGINTIFKASLTTFIRKSYPGIVVEFFPFVSKELADSFVNDGAVREISLKKFNLPGDIIDHLGLAEYQEDILYIEFKVRAKRKHSFLGLNKSVKNFVKDKNTKFFEISELIKLGFDGNHKVSIVSQLNGNNRTIDLSDTWQIRPYYDINKEVEKDKSMHPNFVSIDKIARTLLEEFVKSPNFQKA